MDTRDILVSFLEDVFTYGDATNTHLIWGRNASQPAVETDANPRLACAILDETCVYCSEDCPAAVSTD